MTYFSVYYSVSNGFEIDFPFFQMTISTAALVVIASAVVALRIAKVIRSRKSVAQVSEPVEWEISEPSPFSWES